MTVPSPLWVPGPSWSGFQDEHTAAMAWPLVYPSHAYSKVGYNTGQHMTLAVLSQCLLDE
jgi:hypothetical protein